MGSYDHGRDALLARDVEKNSQGHWSSVPCRNAGKCDDCGTRVFQRLPWELPERALALNLCVPCARVRSEDEGKVSRG